MKLASLLAQYLYAQKKLDLPGIGSFLLDPAVIVEQESNRQGKMPNLEGVSFENNTAVKESPDLIQFIASQTGKIKALASADLHSHLELAKQFLNIGKPFLFEGIGSLTKVRTGEYNFTAGQVITEKMTAQPVKEAAATASAEEPARDFHSAFYKQKPKPRWRKPVVALLVLAGLALAVWGGYTIYKRNSGKEDTAQMASTEIKKDETVLLPDTTKPANNDSITNQTPVVPAPAGTMKFVLETSPAKRAFERFGRLKTFQWNVQMETSDSVSYTLYMMLPATPADTTRLLDSLTRLTGRRVYIQP